jgi:phosphoglucosamine mutase
MRKHGYNVGGEQSGHIVLSDYATTGDGLIAALQVLAVIARRERKVSEITRMFEPVPQILKNARRIEGEPLKDKKVVSLIAAGRGKLGDNGRILIRPSGTEPLIRVMAEGDDEHLIRNIVGEIVEAIENAAR